MYGRLHGALLVLLALGVVGGGAQTGTDSLSTADLLVDLARDHGLTRRGQQTDADVTHVRVLLEAALRLDPEHERAHAWLYELSALAGDDVAAARQVAGLLKADPLNELAFARWLEAGIDAQQTVEQRIEWLEAVAASQRPPALLSIAHTHLACQALEQMDLAACHGHLSRALELSPQNLAAAALRWDMLPPDAPPVDRLRAALDVLRLQPLSVDAAWHVARILHEVGLAQEAARFYAYAVEVHERAYPRVPVPAPFLLDRVYNYLAIDDLEAAIRTARSVIINAPEYAAEAGILLHYLLRRAERTLDGDSLKLQLAQRFAAVREPAEFTIDEVTQAAWFYCRVDPQPQRALMLAENAFARAPDDPFVRRVFGWAQAENLQADAALETLRPIAPEDPYAAWMVARLLREAEQDLQAMAVLAALEQRPITGPAADLLREADLTATSQPAPQAATVRAVLAAFDERVLEFHRDPARFLEAQLQIVDRSPGPGQPWWAEISLTNRAPFAITLGPDGLVNPVFLLSFELEGDRKRVYPHLLSVAVDRRQALLPGETVTVRRTIDLGPLRSVTRQTPQHLQRVTVAAILDPEQDATGSWGPSVSGQTLRPVYFNRVPAGAGRESIAALLRAMTGESRPGAWRAIEVLAELLGERQRADLKRLSYRPESIPAGRIRAALLGLLDSDDWETRARVLDALHVVGLDAEMAAAVERCLAHEHWLVRLMAVRLLARQGERFGPQARLLAEQDEDALVRDLAQSYVEQFARDAGAPEATEPPKSDVENAR